MPVAERLPFMMVELAVFALVSGAFSGKIAENGAWAFLAVISAQLIGRASFLLMAVIFQNLVSFTPAMIWSQICTGLVGALVQAILVPVIIILLRKLLLKESKND